jgi:hypothetical protein
MPIPPIKENDFLTTSVRAISNLKANWDVVYAGQGHVGFCNLSVLMPSCTVLK